ncbi:hypothetical protein HPL003_15010 [Paenibacillus terrae HPL-003]|uniref:RNA polymerase sigma-70 region 2 domain-containing protein n=1 Tax=Paenibacillus terrae (strain HPL-003) TaxID=985665 RepID=G7W4B5_PAETH|nr:sigma-70 family RNA polymerase sigma factor [Paenibacillus terrae]AET59753.1 hypothetical protein HPL003_15010 [Paenibacillus terrae HPL-003]
MITTNVSSFNPDTLNHIFNFILRGVNEEDREDVKQDSIVQILTAIHNGNIKKDISTFSHTVIKRSVVDYYRKKKRKITQFSTTVNFCDGTDEEGSKANYYSVQVNDYGFKLADVKVDYLSNRSRFTKQEQRIINFMLFTEEGMDMKPAEIAHYLDIHKSHACRAVKKLRELYKTEIDK